MARERGNEPVASSETKRLRIDAIRATTGKAQRGGPALRRQRGVISVMRSEDEREKNPMDGCRSRSARREEEGSNAGGRGEYVVGGGGGDERRCVGVCASGRCGGQCCSGSNDSQAVWCGVWCVVRDERGEHTKR